MKLAKKLEAEILKVYNTYWECYLKGDVKTMASLLADEYKQVGSAESEVFSTKKDAVKFLHDTIDQVAGKLQMRKRKIKLEQPDNLILVHELCDVYALADEDWIFYAKFRASTLMQKKKEKWKIIHQHTSFPDIRTDGGENIAIEKIAEENLQLREAVKRRTVALESKNRELEIETALERVRVVAMGMKRPDDLLEVAKTQFNELKKLGFTELRNAWIGIFYDDKNFFIDYDFSDFSGGAITQIPYHKNKVVDSAIKRMKSANDAFTEFIVKGKEFREWNDFRKQNGEYDDTRLKNTDKLFYYFYSIDAGNIGISTFKKISEEQLFILRRFRNVFDLAYRRYVDITTAEAQAREAQIEVSLEKVRAQALGMHKPADLLNVCQVVFKELLTLGVDEIRNALIHTFNDEEKFLMDYDYADSTGGAITRMPYGGNASMENFLSQIRKSDNAFAELIVQGRELTAWKKFRRKVGQQDDPRLNKTSSICYYVYSVGEASIGISTFGDITEEKKQLLRRFRNVFDFAFRRYMDVAQAEAQAKEARIEAALERVRSRSMGMQKSEELKEVIQVVYEQFVHLNINTEHTGFVMDYKVRDDRLIWVASKHGVPSQLTIPYFDSEYYNRFNEAKEKGRDFFATNLSFEEKNSFYQKLFTYIPELPDEAKEFYFNCPGLAISTVLLENVGLYIENFEGIPYSDEDNATLMRFGKVFQQTYTRFLDLQKAEAQTREAKIEMALEKVRSRTMAMQRSEELGNVATVLFKQLNQLVENLWTCGFVLCEKDRGEDEWWLSTGDGFIPAFYLPNTGDATHANIYDAWKKGETYHKEQLEGKALQEHYDWLMSIPVSKNIFDEMNAAGHSLPTWQKLHCAYFSYGYLVMITQVPCPEEQIFKRFAQVFDQTYTRFLDLQKAEAQARESQIQLALERVRARTMAMHGSNELGEVAVLLFEQIRQLGIETYASGFNIWNKDDKKLTSWMSNPTGSINPPFEMPIHTYEQHSRIYSAWKKNEKFLEDDIKGKRVVKHYQFLRSFPLLDAAFKQSEEAGIKTPDRQVHNIAFFSQGYLLFITLESSSQFHDIFIRFAKVFDQTYTRFLDLQKAEAQAREAKIEASLEKVRARTMGMQRSDELPQAANLLFQQIQSLGMPAWSAGYCIWDEDKKGVTLWMSSEGVLQPPFKAPLTEDPSFIHMREAYDRGETFYAEEIGGEELVTHYKYMRTLPVVGEILDSIIEAGHPLPTFQIFHVAYFSQGFLLFITYEPVPEAHDIFKRFGKVFDQTYTRFLDLKNAEAQAREAKIEASLERVRSKTMAMHNSQDVGETVVVIFDELSKLGVETIRCGVGIMHETKDMELWTAKPNENGKVDLVIGWMNMNIHPLLQGALRGWKNKQETYSYELNGDDLVNYFTAINNHPGYPVNYDVATLPSTIFHNEFYFSEGTLFSFSLTQLTDEVRKIFKRFAGVFGQTYRRYLDLQKAEAQAREAQIEASLERVRSKTMAMHNSQDVGETVVAMFAEFVHLDIHTNRCGILIFNDENSAEVWTARSTPEQKASLIIGRLNLRTHRLLISVHAAWKAKNSFYQYDLFGDDLANYYQAINNSEFYRTRFDMNALPSKEFHSDFLFSEGAVFTFTEEPIAEEHSKIIKRFASVFGQTYRRYLDLLNAEAQARESQIEAALERVRGKAMAMHNSNDVSAAASMVFTELRKLGITPIRCGVGLLNKESRKAQLYSATSSPAGDSLSLVGWVELSDHPVLENIYDTWLKNEDYYPELAGEQLGSYYQLLLRGLPVAVPDWQSGDKQYGHFLSSSVGCLYAWSETRYNEAEIKILKRFSAIIDLTFRRYIELQTSEANAREAVKQAALDRIRADIASMRTINDLERITPLIWNELTILGIPFMRCGVFIMDDAQHLIHTFLSTPDGKAIAAFHLPYDTPGNIGEVLSHWRNNKNYIDHWDEAVFTEFADTLVKQGALTSSEQYLKTIPRGGFHLHFLPFLQGMLYVGNSEKLGEEEIKLIQSVADAFSTAYARYEDFNKLEAAKQQVDKTLVELKQAQTQLVQSEKMASLGELTAGIAHEIQNPLNFVNNFSDVTSELIDEMMEEVAKGNHDEAQAIADDVKQNLEKISHHGKRADGIVKGMLQHSRTSSSQKELTDINTLADEYLRLSYHGLRAKDKSFNAKFETSFDNTIGKVNIIPQDIGRVILNLINNAFYAVTEKKKQNIEGYEPTVTVITARVNGKVEVTVKDNGIGISQKNLDKIFQPFFTTKPTGQGTGLGLSLAYDIITKGHGGELKVETTEGQGSQFIIQLPIQA